jgi:transglutaminase-like putative cysteine protease
MVRIKRLLDLLCAVVALLSIGPIFGYLDRSLLLLTFLAIPLGYWCDRRERYLLPGWFATVLSFIGMGFYSVQITRAEVAIPVVHAMIVLLVVRLLTPKENRDYLQIFVLSLFILAGASLIHLELAFAVYLVLLVFGVTLGLVLLTVHVTDKTLIMTRADLVKLVKVGLILPSVSLVLMVVFFVVLPRTQHPMWDFLNPAAKGVVGLSESVQPGSFSRLSTVDELVFRAEGPELAPEDRYWRGLVLNQSRGGRWVREDPPDEPLRKVEGPAPIMYRVFLEPRSDRYLMTLDSPTQVSRVKKRQSDDRVFLATRSINKRLRYDVVGRPGGRLVMSGEINQQFYLQPPDDVSPRMQQLATTIREGNSDSKSRAEALADFFREQNLQYAQDDLPVGADPIDEFLFDKKRGYCEFFASAYVSLARLAGIPSRLVGGYFGGDYNPIGGYYQVSEDTAHIWVEILTEDNRWQRVDPSQWAVNASTTWGERPDSGLMTLSQIVDTLNYQWVQAVIFFDMYQQVSFLSDAASKVRSLRTLKAPQGWWKGLVGLFVVVVVTMLLFKLRGHSREHVLLESLRKQVAARYDDDELPQGMGLVEISERYDNDACREFARIYYGAVFRDRKLSSSEYQQLKDLLKKI